MWIEPTTTRLLPGHERQQMKSPLNHFDLPALVMKIKKKHKVGCSDPDFLVLLNTPTKQIVLTTMHEGTGIISFQSNESIAFQILEGKMLFHTRNSSVNLVKGQLLMFSENVKYGLTTDVETILLLTITSVALQLSEN